MRTYFLKSILLIIIILLSPSNIQSQDPNFQLDLIFSSDNITHDRISQVLRQQLNPLLIDVNIIGSPQPIYFYDLINHNYDMAIFSIDTINDHFPPLWKQFSPNSYTGSNFYRLSEQQVLDNFEYNDQIHFFNALDAYKLTPSVDEKIELAKNITQHYNDKFILDIPLVSTSTAIINSKNLNNFDSDEGLINSLLLGSKWTNNSNERINQNRSINEIHYALSNFQQLNNPIYYQGREGYIPLEGFFSSAFLIDKNKKIHPNLAISFEDLKYSNGTNIIILNLRQDATWSDGNKLDAYDLKFTYDLVSFDWIGATNHIDWQNLSSIEIINNYQIKLTFNTTSLNNIYSIANQYIIPEHSLNQSIEINDVLYHPYDGFSPIKTTLWQEYISKPITAGPFTYDIINSRSNVVEIGNLNLNYWSPSIFDTENMIFNITSNEKHSPYFFNNFENINIEKLIYHVSGSQNIDQNSLINTLLSGSRDVIELPNLSSPEIFDQDRFEVNFVGNSGGGLIILLNLDNINLNVFEARKAISTAINREEISNLLGQGYSPQNGPISVHYENFYSTNSSISYNLTLAKNIFKSLGYMTSSEMFSSSENYVYPWEGFVNHEQTTIYTALICLTLYKIKLRQK